jgi:TetR/AcrR family transcriptional regulator, regulator of cefoperazone and chloramphenicol sensitivity
MIIPRNEDAKQALMEAAVSLMRETQDPRSLTVRQIAARANVNAALVSYYYGSKDELIHAAVDEIMQTEAGKWLMPPDGETDPMLRLKGMLRQMSDMVINYYQFTKVSLEFAITQGSTEIPQMLLPLMRSILLDRDERELRLLSFMLIAGLQSALVRHDAFHSYTGYDPFDKKQRDEILNKLVDMLLSY